MKLVLTIYQFVLITYALSLMACNEKSFAVTFSGEAQGTTYQVTYSAPVNVNLQQEIDSILNKIDLSLSTYLPSSIISSINRNDTNIQPDTHFITVFMKAKEIAERTGGAFDFTIAPLINAWGFGFTDKKNIEPNAIDSLLKLVDYRFVSLKSGMVSKVHENVLLDFNAIAQGYTVDVIAAFIETKGINNYLVELGGEVAGKGMNEKGTYWKIGIDRPDENHPDGRPINAVIELQNKALATSGNYRKFYVENGKKYAHIIDPKTGYPAKNNLLSATVIANDCMTADAYATAFMVMGLDKSKQFLERNHGLNLEVYFIYDSANRYNFYTSTQMNTWLRQIN